MSTRRSPLPNRVDPFGEIHAVAARGLMMGNRGGRIHDGWRITRKQGSRHWLICVTAFKDRRRKVMESGYTELFFLDEATALAAGHRPCFECRRRDALAFAAAFGLKRADDIDRVLAAERLRPHPVADLADNLTDGAMVARDGAAFLVWRGALRRWSFDGYGPAEPLSGDLSLLTPPASVAALRAGYQASLHPSLR